MSDETKKHTEEEIRVAAEGISKKVKEAYAALEDAKELADKFGLSFRFAPAYGMGGSYYSEEKAEDYGYEHAGWTASSQTC